MKCPDCGTEIESAQASSHYPLCKGRAAHNVAKSDEAQARWDTFHKMMHIRVDDEFPRILKLGSETTVSRQSPEGVLLATIPLYYGWIQNTTERVRHLYVIIEDALILTHVFPNILSEALNSVGKHFSIIRRDPINNDQFSTEGLIFSGNVFLYCRQLDVRSKQFIAENLAKSKARAIFRDEEYWMKSDRQKNPDLFICHDSADKDFVRALHKTLSNIFVKAWLDEESLEIGDSLQMSIDKAIRTTKFALVIISQSFLKNEGWARHEFTSIMNRQIVEQREFILPIWLGVSEKEIALYSARLPDFLALNADLGLEKIAKKLKARVQRG